MFVQYVCQAQDGSIASLDKINSTPCQQYDNSHCVNIYSGPYFPEVYSNNAVLVLQVKHGLNR